MANRQPTHDTRVHQSPILSSQDDCKNAPPAFCSDGTPKTKLYSIGDGLCLQVTPSKVATDGTYGVSRSWLFRFSIDSRERRMGLGPIDRLSLDKARIKAMALRELVDQKIDPLDQKRHERDERVRKHAARKVTSKTFRQCTEEYVAAHKDGWSGKVYRDQWARSLEIYAYPIIGDFPVSDIDEALVLQVLEPIWRVKITTAKRLRDRIARVLGFAAFKGYRPIGPNPAAWIDNLAHALPKPSQVRPTRHHRALDYKKVGSFMTRLREYPGACARALEFAILTASRTGEVRLAKWSEIDLEQRLWTVPVGRTKMRRDEERTDYIVPLSAAAVSILETIKGDGESDPNGYVFIVRFGTRIAESSMLRVCQYLNPNITPHGFRSCFSDWAGDETDAAEETREFCLAHIMRGTASAYRRKTAVKKRAVLLQQWADHCAVVEGSNVAALKRSA
jgi:integrase